MIRPVRGLVLLAVFGLSACAQAPFTAQPVASKPAGGGNHPRFAPPPGGHSHWDGQLGVYVVSAQAHLYYRERTYYHWDGGWHWSTSASGPWARTELSGVPPGLSRHYQQ